MEREAASMGGLIVLEPLGDRKTQHFRREMAAAGDLDVLGVKYPRMQLLTVPEILSGHYFNTPGRVARGTGQGVLISP